MVQSHHTLAFLVFTLSLPVALPVYATKPAIEQTIELSPQQSTTITEETIQIPETHSTPPDVRKKLSQDEQSYPVSSAKKLGKGVVDMATSWLQIPKTVSQTSQESGILVGLTGGVVKGVVNTVKQAVTGAVDIVTFPIPEQSTTEPDNSAAEEFDMEASFGKAFSVDKMSTGPEGNKPINQ